VRGNTPAAKPAGRLVDIPAASSQGAATASVARWLPRAALPTPRGRFATATIEHEVYVIGGLTGEGWSDRVEVYDVHQDLFARRAPLPLAVANVGAAVVGERIYVPGGLTAADALTDRLQVYDPAADAWSAGPALPQALCAYAIAPYGEGFYLFGGWDGARYLDTVYYYDVATQTWRAEAPLRTPRGFCAAVAVEERLYLLGGYDGQTEHALCESYSPAAYAEGREPWLTHSPMRDGRAGHSAVELEGSLYVVGGGWDRPLRANERYDPRNDAWATFPSPITGQWRTLGLGAVPAALPGQQGAYLYAIGGWDGAAYLATVNAYQASFRVFLP
jgi:N-acetylneuraminic acid mutarotase